MAKKTASYPKAESVKFLTVAAFKQAVGATTLNVVRNPNTGKLFASADDGTNYKVQGDIDPQERMVFLVPDGVLEDACLINAENNSVEPEFTL